VFAATILRAVAGSETEQRDAPRTEVGNQACRPCHQAIYESYSRTAMARTSGTAGTDLEGSFRHARSGVSYRVFRQGQRAVLSYERAGSSALLGTQELKYYVGSNTRGRTFLFEIDGFLYQSPINYYAAKRIWDMSPGYAQLREMELSHPVDSTCLFCHASGRQQPMKGTINRFAGVPFLQDGVGCERCHGPGSDHVNRAGPMVNPAKLTGEQQDSICMQCHLEGEARIVRAARSQADYTPGEALSDYLAVFVREDNQRQRRAVSHVESVAISRCRRAGGAALACVTCHDAHSQPSARDKTASYRAKCIACHTPMAARHFPGEQDCTACHMPRTESADIRHTVVTDHRIVREPRAGQPREQERGRLVQFGNLQPEARDLGLAYGEVALRGDAFAAAEALRLLTSARNQYPDDPELLTRLGYLHQARGEFALAERYYEQVFTKHPDSAIATANLGVFYARRGLLSRSLEIWRRAFDMNPQLSEIGVNLGRGLCAAGDGAGARAVLERVLKHNPDLAIARESLATVSKGGCSRL
jgi:tetratricopeptide (TPR) repeat protein